MGWFRIDDQLREHRKARRAGKAAIGVWTLAGSWSMDNDYDGFVPADVIRRWGTRADAAKLVAAGLWHETERDGEPGWQFHDWDHFQPSAAVTAARKAKEAEAGLRGNHKRWHADRGVVDPNCEYCYRVPDSPPDEGPDDLPESGGESGANRPVPVPVPNRSSKEDLSRRDDVERICEHLVERIEGNGAKRPTITTTWRTSARLMLDNDKRAEADVHAAIDWCQNDEFWRANILSLPKLREKYDQLRLQANRGGSPPRGQQHTDDLFERALQRGASQ